MKKCIFLLSLTLLFAAKGLTQPDKNNQIIPSTMENQKDSVSYSLGLLIAKNLKGQGLDSLNYDLFLKAMNDVMTGSTLDIPEASANQLITEYMQGAAQRKATKCLEDGKKFLAENGKRKGVITTKSGLQYEVIKEGKGPKPTDLTTNVTAHYHGTLLDGTVFDSSVDRNQPFKTKVGGVIKAWQEALLLMSVGTKLKIYSPSELAYGERGAGGAIGPNSVLIFEMELISIDQ